MTIPQGDPRGLHSVSERRKVTFANEDAAHTSDCKAEEPVKDDDLLDSSAEVKKGEKEQEKIARDQRKSSIEVIPEGGQTEKEVRGETETSLSKHETGIEISIEDKLIRNEKESTPRELRISSLPLLDLPKSTYIASLANCSPNNRKLSLNIPYSNRPALPKKQTPPTSSSASSSNITTFATTTTTSRKSRRKSLPQRLGQRYQKIPQDDFSPCDASPTNPGNLNLACATSPSFNSDLSPEYRQNRPNLSVHNAEVHASFHKDSEQNTSLAHLETFVRIHSAPDAEGTKEKKKRQNALLPESCRSNRKQNLSRAVSLSSKSLDDLTALHTGRGIPDKKRSKKPGRSVSSEDLAGLRIHRAGRPAADPHPSPGSPSRCCLVSVSRVPMAAATSHLTLDSEYQTVRLAVLGAPGVGKSAIVKQFVMQQFLEEYVPTEQRQVFCPAVIINEHLYEVRIIDCPYIPYFPVNSLYEWTDFRGYGLRNATAYVLVYDITSEESFEYIKSLRLQILESRNRHDVPIFVVGNKHDLAEERGVSRREVANLVKKQWKCGYIECSAKYNWHIMLLFKELMKTIDYIDYGHKPTSMRVQDALRRNRCLIL